MESIYPSSIGTSVVESKSKQSFFKSGCGMAIIDSSQKEIVISVDYQQNFSGTCPSLRKNVTRGLDPGRLSPSSRSGIIIPKRNRPARPKSTQYRGIFFRVYGLKSQWIAKQKKGTAKPALIQRSRRRCTAAPSRSRVFRPLFRRPAVRRKKRSTNNVNGARTSFPTTLLIDGHGFRDRP